MTIVNERTSAFNNIMPRGLGGCMSLSHNDRMITEHGYIHNYETLTWALYNFWCFIERHN